MQPSNEIFIYLWLVYLMITLSVPEIT